MRMLGTLLGVPQEDGPWLVEQGDALLGNTDPEFTTPPGRSRRHGGVPARSRSAARPASSCSGTPRSRPGCRREHPTDDVISDLLRPKVDGEVLSEHEFNNFFTLLVAAGNDTTRYTMAAGMKALIERPEAMAELRDAIANGDDELVMSAVEEVLRWGSVTMHFRRTATVDTTIGEQAVRAGDKVVHVVRVGRTTTRRCSPSRSRSTSGARRTRRSPSG